MARDGNATQVTKINLEALIFYSLKVIEDAGKFIVSAPGAGTWTPNAAYTIPGGGVDLVVRARNPIKSAADIVITIAGTDPTAAVISGVATIAGQVSESQSYDVIVALAAKFATITGVTITGGVKGDGFDVSVIPADADFEEIKFDEGMTPSEGDTVKPIYDKYDLDHNKRIRGDNRLTIPAFYTHNLEGLARVKNRDVTIKMEIHDDGYDDISEVKFFDKCRLGVTIETPTAPDDNVRARAEGRFGRMYVFS